MMIAALDKDKRRIDEAMDRSLFSTCEEENKIVDVMRYAALGGKRLRGILTMEFAKMLGLSEEEILPYALAVECVHAYSLIHDDLPCMDDDNMRRGKPSCHIVFGEANALLAGDALLTYAFSLLGECKLSEKNPDRAVKAIIVLASCAGYRGMVGGQVLDLEAVDRQVTENELSLIHKMKTGALIKAAALLGCIGAGADQEIQSLAGGFAEEFGLAFQIIDDLLDFNGDYEECEGNSYVKLHTVERAKMDAYSCVSKAGASLYELDKRGYDTGVFAALLDFLITRMENNRE